MNLTTPAAVSTRRTIPSLRWWIGGLLFASTVINYVDRQTLSVLAPYFKQDYHWTNEDFALVVISFRVAYALGQSFCGRLIDRLGTRLGLSLTVTWYSLAAMVTSLANSLGGFCFFRFLLGAGESGNWPGATKAVSEWFPKRERGWAVALFDSGSSVGAAVAPALVVWLHFRYGWRPAFVMIGMLGFLWLLLWRWLYHPPESHPRISLAEREMILADKQQDTTPGPATGPRPRWVDLAKLPQTWGSIAARSLSDPVWFFITDWFFIYLKQDKHINPEQGLLAAWIPFVGADLGNFFGGGISSWLIRRGWPVGRARKIVIFFGGFGVCMLIPTIFISNLFLVSALFAVATFSYAAYSTMALVLPSDLFRSESVATVSGMGGTGSGLCTILATYLIGYVADRFSFAPVLIASSIIPLVGVILVLVLVRNPQSSDEGLLRRI